jgi:tetratricopeptide (TPR) repeat protein
MVAMFGSDESVMQKVKVSPVVLLVVLTGCAASQVNRVPVTMQAVTVAPVSATAPADSKASLSLNDIVPRPELPLPSSTDVDPASPPLEAVLLFAKARIALLDRRRTDASELLEKAVALDPESFELHKSLGDLYATASDARAVEEWEKAAEIEPDHLQLQIELGRSSSEQDDILKSIEHLRLALLTSEYRRDDPAAGEADFLLARALQQDGYDRAALQMYERLLSRLHNPGMALRANAQVAALLAHPDTLALNVAALYEENKAFGSAVQLLSAISVHQPSNYPLRARLARDAAAAGNQELAIREASDLVARMRADRDSVALLKEIVGKDAIGILQNLRRDNPKDREFAYALSDVLRADGRNAEARQVLKDAAKSWPDDLLLIRRQVELIRESEGPAQAARLVILSLANRPDRALELSPLWDSVTRPLPRGALRLADAQRIEVPASAEAEKLLLVARSAEIGHKDALELKALRQAVNIRPIFEPAWREMLAQIYADESRTPAEKIAASTKLAEDAAQGGDTGFAAELRGQTLLDRGQSQPAAAEFAAAVQAGDRSAELYLNFAAALHGIGDIAGAQSLLWKVIENRRLADYAYTLLYSIYKQQNQPDEAARVLAVWLAADPDNATAGRLRAREAFQHRRFTEAETILLDLFEHHDNDPAVLGALQQFYTETARVDDLVAKLHKRLAAEPWNYLLAISLVQAHERQHRHADALGVLQSLRASASGDPDLLYTVSGLYTQMGESSLSEKVLQDVLKLDPAYPGANNDLGYVWAEQGKNLPGAESLARKALQAEPDNPSFLDTMGWVLYKRGKFQEALQNLTRAALPANPVVLDHLGDTLYRLGDSAKAAVQWRQASLRLSESHEDDGDDLKQLRVQLLKKQQQVDAGQPVGVAPVLEGN